MKKTTKILLITLSVIVLLVLALLLVMKISGNHRSNPEDILSYETDNPFITGKTEIIAHRLGAGIAPEETRLALDLCLEKDNISVDIFEFDVRMTADDQLILFHNQTLDKTTDSVSVFASEAIEVRSKTLAELQQLNLGAQFVDPDGNKPYTNLTEIPDTLRVWTLEDALDYMVSKGIIRFSIEAKDSGELGMKAVDKIHAALKERGLLETTVFSSFKTDVSAYAAETYPDFIRSNTDAQAIEFYLAAITNDKNYEPPCPVFQLPFNDKYLNMGINFATAQIINYAHSHNIALHYWVVDDPERMEYLKSIKADGIMSDYPDRLTETIGADVLQP